MMGATEGSKGDDGLEKILNVLHTQALSSQPEQVSPMKATQFHPENVLVAPDDLLKLIHEQLEAKLADYVKPFDELMEKLQVDMTTLFVASFACRGDLEDTEYFLTDKFDKMKRPPIPPSQLKAVFRSGNWPS